MLGADGGSQNPVVYDGLGADDPARYRACGNFRIADGKSRKVLILKRETFDHTGIDGVGSKVIKPDDICGQMVGQNGVCGKVGVGDRFASEA